MRARGFALCILISQFPPTLHAQDSPSSAVVEASTLSARYPDDGKPPAIIGRLTVAGIGDVTFRAHRAQSRLLITAMTADGSLIGSAESMVALGDTPIFIRAPQGLYKIVVHWVS